MEPASRHQCLLYSGPPSRHLPALAAVTKQKLKERHRCLYLNSSPMVAGMRSYLAAAGVDVERELKDGSLVLSAEQSHLVDGRFDGDRMLLTLEQTLQAALEEGYAGLFASGDMTWEFGPARDFSSLLQYEMNLEKMFHEYPELSGVCQYHAEIMPPEVMRGGLMSHRSIFVNETLSLINPHCIHEAASARVRPEEDPALDAFLSRLMQESAA